MRGWRYPRLVRASTSSPPRVEPLPPWGWGGDDSWTSWTFPTAWPIQRCHSKERDESTSSAVTGMQCASITTQIPRYVQTSWMEVCGLVLMWREAAWGWTATCLWEWEKRYVNTLWLLNKGDLSLIWGNTKASYKTHQFVSLIMWSKKSSMQNHRKISKGVLDTSRTTSKPKNLSFCCQRKNVDPRACQSHTRRVAYRCQAWCPPGWHNLDWREAEIGTVDSTEASW